jgi:hypothetical protein
MLMVRCAAQDTGFELAVHPSSLVMSASLGNVNATDATLPDDNPYRKVIIALHKMHCRCLQVGPYYGTD